MAYLVIKRVKGRPYAYRQESYREGGKVRTRSQYLGPVEPAVADQIAATRKQLGKADMTALVLSVQEATGQSASITTDGHTAPLAPSPAPSQPETTPTAPSEPLAPLRMIVNGRPALVDAATGELIDEPTVSKVITTGNPKPTLRPFREGLELPAKLEQYELSPLAFQRTHARFGQRLKALKINPATMPDVKIKYGHPDRMERNRDGSYSVYASRNPKRRHIIAKGQLWAHYRQALASSYLDAIEGEQPDLYGDLLAELDGERGEIVAILADVQKLGWTAFAERAANNRKQLKSAITRRRNELAKLSTLETLSARLSGKLAKINREIIEAEIELQKAEDFKRQILALKDHLSEY